LVKELPKRRDKFFGGHRRKFCRENDHHYIIHATKMRQLVTNGFVYAATDPVSAGGTLKHLLADHDGKTRSFAVWVTGVLDRDEMRANRLAVLVNVPQAAVTMEPKNIR